MTDELLDQFREGYKTGFADGYKQAMLEVFKNNNEKYMEDLTTPGIQSRPPRTP